MVILIGPLLLQFHMNTLAPNNSNIRTLKDPLSQIKAKMLGLLGCQGNMKMQQ